ncbi:class I SAM-dependent methyltransferase [Galbibacter sp. BG1]|uniref:class I SAM-dependent methyltransferase n=1 Tax=Galbibacter sp. BG1 TaxID=1170699 RepID=UPI0015B7D32A|nr:class I SAM-dependent methyltransferase [Galbibacter sp. BG1]QLE01122.1 class I SAM-dependent methyltransferase [Galbibacter sp. BG1]
METKIEDKTYISVKDHLVSGEVFEIKTTNINGLLKTTPPPSPETLYKYYESEEYISHTDSKETFTDKIYQAVKKYSLKKKKKLIQKYHPEAKTILDIGSGTGDLIQYLKNSYTCVSTEPNDQARSLSIKKGNNVVSDINELGKQKFDVIMMWHVLEHVPNIDNELSKIKDLLADNGILIIAVPNYESYDAKHYKQAWAAYDVPRHLWHFNKISMREILQCKNLFVVKILPLVFDSFYVSLLSEKIKTGKQNWFKAFYIGMKSNLMAKSSGDYSSLIYISKKQP